MYSELMVLPMRKELTAIGFSEMRTPEEVEEQLGSIDSESALIVINSVCGCSAGCARPGISLAVKHSKLPDKLLTVFAGQDAEATNRARLYFPEYPPSSPSIALIKDGKCVHMVQRHEIEGRTPEDIAKNLIDAFEANL